MSDQELQIIEYRPTAAALAELGVRYKGVVFQVTETKGMADAKAARAEIRGYRTDLEKMRKELKADVLEKGRLIDGEAKRITTALEELEEPIYAQIKAEEARKEAERKAKEEAERAAADEIHKRIAEIRNWPSRFIGCSSVKIGIQIDELNPDLSGFGLYEAMARQAHAECMATLTHMLGKAIAHEQEQAQLEAERVELARLQAYQHAQIEADRAELAKLKAMEDERVKAERAKAEEEARAERERLQTERDRQHAELRAQVEAERERMRIEREKQDAELKAQRDEAARIEAENRKARQEAEAKAQAERESERLRLAELAKKERSEDMMQRLTAIANDEIPIFTKLIKAYQMGREDLSRELENN